MRPRVGLQHATTALTLLKLVKLASLFLAQLSTEHQISSESVLMHFFAFLLLWCRFWKPR